MILSHVVICSERLYFEENKFRTQEIIYFITGRFCKKNFLEKIYGKEKRYPHCDYYYI